jgi:transposase
MPKKLQVRLTRAQAAELHTRLEAGGLSKRLRQRIQMVLDADRGDATEKIAFYGEVDVQTVRRWLKAYLRAGLAGLADRPRSGHPTALQEADWTALATLLEESAAGERTWTLPQLVDWLATTRGVRLSPDRLSRHLRARRCRWKRTKRSLQHKANPEQQAHKTADLQTLQAFARAGVIDLVYADAAGFAPTCPVSYTWARQGVRPVLPYEAPRNRRVNAFGAYAPFGPLARFRSRTSTDKLTSEVFLDFLWQHVGGMPTPLGELPADFVRERPCIVVLDNGSVHTSRLVKDQWAVLRAADIHLFYLPTYSPNLNLIEALWRQIKYHELPVRSYPELADLLAAVTQALEQHALDPSFTPKNLRKCA